MGTDLVLCCVEGRHAASDGEGALIGMPIVALPEHVCIPSHGLSRQPEYWHERRADSGTPLIFRTWEACLRVTLAIHLADWLVETLKGV